MKKQKFVYEATVLEVHDGDTIRCGRERVRIANIDAPELPDSPKCQDRRRSYAWCDFAAGEASRVALTRLLSRGRVMITRLGTDPYGRTLATVSVNGVDAGDYLIALSTEKCFGDMHVELQNVCRGFPAEDSEG